MLRKFIGFCIENNITSATVVYGILEPNAISAVPIPLYLRSDFSVRTGLLCGALSAYKT